jgi:hypothetical protein
MRPGYYSIAHLCSDAALTPLSACSQSTNSVIGRVLENSRHKKLWVITEGDRSVTTLLLPEKY